MWLRPAIGSFCEGGVMSELGDFIKAKRRREGLSLRQASAASGVAFSTLGRIESGAEPSLRVDRKLQAWLTGETPVLPPPPMTLRDWFAGQALIGCIMDRASWGVNHSDKAADFARYAFDIADAMLRARGEHPGGEG